MISLPINYATGIPAAFFMYQFKKQRAFPVGNARVFCYIQPVSSDSALGLRRSRGSTTLFALTPR